MINSMIFQCPFLISSKDGARCGAVLSTPKDNLIRELAGANIRLCINNKRRFEVCHIYFDFLKRIAHDKNFYQIQRCNQGKIVQSATSFK
ncbi:MAG: hypothetical protein N2511_03230 [Thermodesulfovibrionales bacterium]|nr:hypothetical protein [Thermodesulfovibrionales bacterium]